MGRLRGRADLAGALALGTVILSVLVIGSRGQLAAGALFAGTEAFAISAMVANGLPTIRDLVLMPLRIIGWITVVLLLVTATIPAMPLLLAGPPVGTEPLVLMSALVAFALFATGVASSAAVTRVFGGDLRAVLGGAGLRDPALGVALATIASGPDSTGVPLLYAVFCLGLAAFALRRR